MVATKPVLVAPAVQEGLMPALESIAPKCRGPSRNRDVRDIPPHSCLSDNQSMFWEAFGTVRSAQEWCLSAPRHEGEFVFGPDG